MNIDLNGIMRHYFIDFRRKWEIYLKVNKNHHLKFFYFQCLLKFIFHGCNKKFCQKHFLLIEKNFALKCFKWSKKLFIFVILNFYKWSQTLFENFKKYFFRKFYFRYLICEKVFLTLLTIFDFSRFKKTDK